MRFSSIQKLIVQPTLLNLHNNEYIQEFHYHMFAVELNTCLESCNTLNDLSNKVCIPNKTEDLNLSVFNLVTGINESKKLTKHISNQCNSNQWWNNNKCRCECKKNSCMWKRLFLESCYM